MSCWLVPRHKAEVAATTRTKKTAAATARQKLTPQRPEQRSEVPENRGPQRNKDCGWRLWRYASSFNPPRSPAGASHNIHHEVNNHFSVP